LQISLLYFSQIDLKNNTILIIGLQYPEPKSTAAGHRMLQLIQLLKSYEYSIHFATANQKNEYSANLTELGIEQHKLELNNSQSDEILKSIKPDLVLFDRFITEEQFGWRVDDCCPNALKILDTEDLHFLREAREKSITKSVNISNSFKLSDKAKRELAAIYRCDLTLMISKAEIDILTNEYNMPADLLFYLPFVYNTTSLLDTKNAGFSERRHFMSIGNFKHKPNLDMVLYLYKEIWPLIRKDLKDAEWHIYGAYVPEQIDQLHQPKKGVYVKGRAEEVLSTMSSYKVMLAPLRFGSGLKGKCLDAMLVGTPSVTTEIGAEGIASAENWPGFVTQEPQLFANQAIELYQNEKLWEQKQQKGFEILKNKFDVNSFSEDLQLTIALALKQLRVIREKNIVGELLKHHHHRSTKFMSLWIEEKNK
jgi:glycosyltransferase involved in cell wall biosynthesis